MIFTSPVIEVRHLPACQHDTTIQNTTEAVNDNGLCDFFTLTACPVQNSGNLKRRLLKLYASLRNQLESSKQGVVNAEVWVYLSSILEERIFKIIVIHPQLLLSKKPGASIGLAGVLDKIILPDLLRMVLDITIRRLVLRIMQTSLYESCKLLPDKKSTAYEVKKRIDYLFPPAPVELTEQTTMKDFSQDCTLFVERVMRSLEQRGFPKKVSGTRLFRIRRL